MEYQRRFQEKLFQVSLIILHYFVSLLLIEQLILTPKPTKR
jgi:hypothetical protein